MFEFLCQLNHSSLSSNLATINKHFAQPQQPVELSVVFRLQNRPLIRAKYRLAVVLLALRSIANEWWRKRGRFSLRTLLL